MVSVSLAMVESRWFSAPTERADRRFSVAHGAGSRKRSGYGKHHFFGRPVGFWHVNGMAVRANTPHYLYGALITGALATTLAACQDVGFFGGGEPPAAVKMKPESGGTATPEHTSELQSRLHLVCRLLLEKKKKKSEQQ